MKLDSAPFLFLEFFQYLIFKISACLKTSSFQVVLDGDFKSVISMTLGQ